MWHIICLLAMVGLLATDAGANSKCGTKDPRSTIILCTAVLDKFTDVDIRTDALGHRGLAYLNSGDYEAALKDGMELRSLDPKVHLGHGLAGMAYTVKGEWAQAVASLNEALLRNPSIENYIAARGRALVGAERYNDAIKDLSIAVKNSPTESTWLGYRAIAYSKTKRFDEALADINYAVWAQPQFILWYLVRTEILANKGDIAGAKKDVEKVLSLDPHNLQAKALKLGLEMAAQVKKK